MTRRRVVAVVATTAAAVVVAGVAWTVWPRGTTEVTTRDAIQEFRSRSRPGGVRSTTLPAPGVYRYRTRGQEAVKLGPLPADTRPLPDTVTAVVVDRDRGCFDFTLNFFAEHTETTRYCTTRAGALTIDGNTKHQRIGAFSPTATTTCAPNVILTPAATSTALRCELDLTGGPASISATLDGTARRRGVETVSIAGESVAATPLTVTYTVSGDLSGTWTETLWLDADHLPVRISRDLHLSGIATFSERSRLRLVDQSPET